MYFDTHAHYDDLRYEPCRERIFKELYDYGIGSVMLVGTDLASSEKACMIKRSYGGMGVRLYAAVGVHPLYIPDKDCIPGLRRLIEEYDVDALGEMGFDLRGRSGQEKSEVRCRQGELFERQLELCVEYGLPAIVHSVEAAQPTFDILMKHSLVKGVIHGFSYPARMALRFCLAGWYIGIGCGICRLGAKKAVSVAAALPRECILAETDCPFQSVSGSVSAVSGIPDSLQIRDIVRRIALIRDVSEDEMCAILEDNAKRLFG